MHSRALVYGAALTTLFFAFTSDGGETAKLRLPPLSTSDSGRLPGKFVWADLVTDDVPTARKFYGRLFGWTFREMDKYTLAANDDRALCGLLQRARPEGSKASPRWIGYISVANISKVEKAVEQAGGRVLAAPHKYPDRGEQAVFADPQGAVFGVLKSSSGDPQDFLPDPGDWIWAELLSRDARQAGDFYRTVAGYQVAENTTSQRSADFVLVSDGYARGAILTIPEAHSEVRPNWLFFVRVSSVSESIAKAKELGGRVLIPPRPDLFDGRVAVIADPTGAAIGIMEWSHDEAKGGR